MNTIIVFKVGYSEMRVVGSNGRKLAALLPARRARARVLPSIQMLPHQLVKRRGVGYKVDSEGQRQTGAAHASLPRRARRAPSIWSLSAQGGRGCSPAGSCFAWALTAPFLALILTPVSDGLGAACCVDIQQGTGASPGTRCLS